MPGLVSPRQFGTEAYSLGRLPVQQNQLGTLNLRTPDRGGKTPTEDPTENPTESGNSKGIAGRSSAGAGAGIAAGSKAGAGKKSMSLLQRIEEPFDPHSGVNQGFERQLGKTGKWLDNTGHDIGHYVWDVTSPNSKAGHVISDVMNFGNPFPAGSPGGPRVSPQQFSGVGETTAKSAVGQPEGGFSGFVQTAESVGSKVGSAIADAAEALF